MCVCVYVFCECVKKVILSALNQMGLGTTSTRTLDDCLALFLVRVIKLCTRANIIHTC